MPGGLRNPPFLLAGQEGEANDNIATCRRTLQHRYCLSHCEKSRFAFERHERVPSVNLFRTVTSVYQRAGGRT